MHPLQESAVEYGEEVRAAIAGNLCRCTGYRKIEDSILCVTEKNLREKIKGRRL